ncbi:hypothetical protein NESM_000179500 [Novymonas esmeraldas]|uniref:Uncharacterized protein n=1 Tax=Novymonas esmeraldas TaxID=1808958 RepID=A0AAW0F5T8_9TRYP
MTSTSGPASPEEAALASLSCFSSEQLHMAEAALQAALMDKVRAIAAEHGEAFIQNLLQREIARTKKMEAQLTTVKKRLGAQERVLHDTQAEVRAVKVHEEKSKFICHNLQDVTKKREQLTEKMEAEMAAYRNDTQARVSQNVQNLVAECEKRRERVEAAEAEAAELEKELEEKKADFESSFADLQDGLTGRTAQYQELIGAYQEATREVEVLEARLMLLRRERNSVEMARAALQQQLELYEKQVDSFAKAVMKPADIEVFAQQQRDQSQARIAALETEKAAVHQQRLQMDKELVELRAKLAALRREVPQLEKAKVAAEKRCRQAQQARQEKK